METGGTLSIGMLAGSIAALVMILLLILRNPHYSTRSRFIFQHGQLLQQTGEVPVSTRQKLLELARAFHLSGIVELDTMGEIHFQGAITKNDQRRIRNALATSGALPRPHC